MKKQLLELSLAVFIIFMVFFLIIDYIYYLVVGDISNAVFLIDAIISAIASIIFYSRNRKEFS